LREDFRCARSSADSLINFNDYWDFDYPKDADSLRNGGTPIMPNDSDNKLVGTWKLVSASSTTSTGERSETPYGPDPAGFLTYTGDGRISTVISYGGRKPISFGREGLALMEEQAEAFKTFLAYAGRYTLSGDEVTHHVEVSSIQNYMNRDLVRSVKFQDDRIILVTPPTPVNGKIQTVELTWQRLPADFGVNQ
jgi:hypothetical protein